MCSQKMSEPLSGFLQLRESYKSAIIYQSLSKFSILQFVNYFIDAVAADSNSKLDFKSLRESSFHLFKAGHIQDSYVTLGFQTVIIVATCLPEMQQDRIYKLMMRLEASNLALLSVLDEHIASSAVTTIQENHTFTASNAFQKRIKYKRGLQVSSTERLGIFQTTKDQHRDSKWFHTRKGRTTGSVCSRIANRSEPIFPKSILSSIICDKI